MPKFVIAALYHFTDFPDPSAVREHLEAEARGAGVKGTLIVAGEGINGTIAGSREGIDRMLGAIRGLPGCGGLEHKESLSDAPPFPRLKIKEKAEIVTMGEPGVAPADRVGTYVAPEDWNALVAEDDVVVIDTRNDYEVAIGTFEGALDPGTTSFREFPDWWRARRDAFEGKRVAMFCTGGIRCEKATSFLLGEGVEDVFHLKGGILKYLETVPEEESRWNGACFVFDKRVSVEHGLKEGEHTLCHACGWPVSDEDRESPDYEKGVACPACKDQYSEAQRERFRMRQRQFDAAKAES